MPGRTALVYATASTRISHDLFVWPLGSVTVLLISFEVSIIGAVRVFSASPCYVVIKTQYNGSHHPPCAGRLTSAVNPICHGIHSATCMSGWCLGMCFSIRPSWLEYVQRPVSGPST